MPASDPMRPRARAAAARTSGLPSRRYAASVPPPSARRSSNAWISFSVAIGGAASTDSERGPKTTRANVAGMATRRSRRKIMTSQLRTMGWRSGCRAPRGASSDRAVRLRGLLGQELLHVILEHLLRLQSYVAPPDTTGAVDEECGRDALDAAVRTNRGTIGHDERVVDRHF